MSVYIKIVCVIFGGLILLMLRWKWKKYWKRRMQREQRDIVLGMFHLNDVDGSGEGLLWSAVYALQDQYPYMNIIPYIGKLRIDSEELFSKPEKALKVKLQGNVQFVS